MRYRPFPHRRCLRPRRSSLRRRGVIRLGRHGLTVRRGPATSLTLEHRPDADQATLTGAPESPVSMRSAPKDKVRFFLDLFCCRSDVYALRWENRRDGRSGWMPAIRGYWRNGMNRADAPYLPLTPDVVGQHLRGEVHIGLYSLGDDDTCWWVAAPRSVPKRWPKICRDSCRHSCRPERPHAGNQRLHRCWRPSVRRRPAMDGPSRISLTAQRAILVAFGAYRSRSNLVPEEVCDRRRQPLSPLLHSRIRR